MTSTDSQQTAAELEYYLPAMPRLSIEPGRIERFLSTYLSHV